MSPRAVLALGCLSLWVLALAATPAGGQQEDDPDAGATVDLVLVDRGRWAGDDGTVPIDVRVDGEVGDTTVRVRVHRALRDAEELAASLDGDVGTVVFASEPVPTADLPVTDGDTRRVEVSAEDLGRPGVHPVVVEIREPDGTVIDLVRTPVIRLGTDGDPLLAPTLTLLVDVAARPTLRPDTPDPDDPDPDDPDDADPSRRALTDAELARAERLAALLEDPDVPATLFAVPDTVDALRASTDPRASALLDALDPAGADRRTVRMPYVPTSARSLTDAAIGTALGRSFEAGSSILVDHFGATPDPTIWPDDDLDQAAIELLSALGVTHVVLPAPSPEPDPPDDAALAPLGPRPVESGAGTGVGAIQVDRVTTDRLLARASERVDAAHVTVADLLLRDDGNASIVALRVDDAPAGSRLLTVLELLTADDAPVALAPLDVPAVDEDATPVSVDPRPEPDLTALSDEYREAATALGGVDDIVDADSSRASELSRQLVTALATGLDDDTRRRLLDAVTAAARTSLDAVRITGQTDLNLTSRTGSLPVGVVNGNDFPVQVMIRIRSDRLRFPEGEELLVDAEPGVTRIDIAVEALATGSVPTFVELRSADGSVLLDDRQLNVRSTAFSGVGLALGLGALVVLGVWWFRSWRRAGPVDDDAPEGTAPHDHASSQHAPPAT